jgi:hypothetical protein
MKTIKYLRILFLSAGIAFTAGCADYLDIVPDGVATMDNAFSTRINAEKFLFTCYSYLPNPVNIITSPALLAAGDEMWLNTDHTALVNGTRSALEIIYGNQNTNDPYLNYWGGRQNGTNLFIALRDCNIFLENIHRTRDMEDEERIRWIAEVKFLKAYFHFFLLQLYGPVPIVRENIAVNATPDEVRVYREPVDDVINYIVQLLDEATKDLPMTIDETITEHGRITKPIALAVKAKALVFAASPLFNGDERTPPEFSRTDNRGVQLFPQTYSAEKWQRAAVAIKNAIDTCHQGYHALYRYNPVGVSLSSISPITRQKYSIRCAVTEKLNPEIIWPLTQSISMSLDGQSTTYQQLCFPKVGTAGLITAQSDLSGTLKVAEQYYTSNGIPIDEDPEWDYDHRYETQVSDGAIADAHQYYIRTGQATAKLNFYREPRFYASLCFDRGIFEGAGQSEANSYWLSARAGEAQGFTAVQQHIITGYFIKKVVNMETVKNGTTYQEKRYSFPVIRLADLYLLYAEALNETKATPDAEVYRWIDSVRIRAGLDGVLNSWAKAAAQYRQKPYTKEGMREIIKRERLIELAFEGQRFWDLRRWKDAMRYLNEPLQGWNYQGSTLETYYTVVTYSNNRRFTVKDYLWPLRTNDIIVNSNLEQNPGW